MATLASLVINLKARTAEFHAAMDRASGTIKGFEKTTARAAQGFVKSQVTQVASLAALTAGIRASIRAADAWDASNRELAASASLTGQSLGFLQEIAAAAREQFSLSRIEANQYTEEIVRLASAAGKASQSQQLFAAVMDLAAARGLKAEDALTLVQSAASGVERGMQKLLGIQLEPVLRAQAAAIGTTVDKLTEEQRALILINTLIEQGTRVQGKWTEFMKSGAGAADDFSDQLSDLGVTFGTALDGARRFVAWLGTGLLKGLELVVQGVQRVGVLIGFGFSAGFELAKAAMAKFLLALATLVGAAGDLIRKLGIDVGEGLAERLAAAGTNLLHSASEALRNLRAGLPEALTVEVSRGGGGTGIDRPFRPPPPTGATAAAIFPLQEKLDRLATLFGERMATAFEAQFGRRDIFGKLMTPAGGFLGATVAGRQLVGAQPFLPMTTLPAPIEKGLDPLARRLLEFRVFLDRATESLKRLPGIALDLGRKFLDMFNPLRLTSTLLDEAFREAARSMETLKAPVARIAHALATALKPVFDALAPVFEKLGPIIKAVAEIFAALVVAITPVLEAVVPLLRALFPVLKAVAIGFTYVAQLAFNLAGGIATVVGWILKAAGALVEGIGKFLNAILPGDPFKFLEKAGRAVKRAGEAWLDTADGLFEAAAAMAHARDVIRDIELADTLEDLGEAARQATEALRNVPTGFKIALARFRASDPTDPGGYFGHGLEFTTGGQRSATYNVTIVSNDPDEVWRGLERLMVQNGIRQYGTPVYQGAG